MKLDKFTQKSQEAIFQAQEIARDYNHQSIEPAHLLLGLIRQEQGCPCHRDQSGRQRAGSAR